MPNAVPSADCALTRKSVCGQTIAMLFVGSTTLTIPTRPSGATTGLKAATPAREPADNTTVYSSPGLRLKSASAGTNPHRRRRPRPSTRRRRSFSRSSSGTRIAASTTESRSARVRSRASHARRVNSALYCSDSSGATMLRRSAAAKGSRTLCGSMSVTKDRPTHAPNNRVSRRPETRDATVSSGAQDRPVLLLVVENASGTAHDARERILIDMNRKAGFLRKKQVESADERATTRHHDAAIDDVARELGGRDFQRATHGVDDLLDRLLNGFANLARVNAHGLRNTAHEVAPLHFHLALFAHRCRRPDLDLDLLGGRFADEQVVILAHELHDRRIQLVAAGADRGIAHDPGQRDDGDFRRPATDINYHVASRRLHGQPHPDRRRHWLRHHEHFLRARA